MDTDAKLGDSYGVKFDFQIKSETRAFDRVDAAAQKAQIRYDHMPEKPTLSQAIARAINFLMRVCMASIEFPSWSPFAQWEEEYPVYAVVKGTRTKVGTNRVKKSGRNPNFSLKFTMVKQAHTDASTTWRVNIANRNKTAENMGHVLSVTYDPSYGKPYFTPGTDMAAYGAFGREVQEIINNEFLRFANNYNDEDIRKVLDAELTDMRALRIINKTNTFVPHAEVDRAKALYQFAKDCGQVVSWLGLDKSDMTRDSLLADLQKAIMADMDEYEATLEEKLNTPTKERKRGEKQRQRMYDTAVENIDGIFAMAEYHAQVLGCMAEGIIERRDALKAKAAQLLTKDFDATPVQASEPTTALVEVEPFKPVSNPEEAFE